MQTFVIDVVPAERIEVLDVPLRQIRRVPGQRDRKRNDLTK
ncbi:hypothetical protein [Fibrisoma limi]|nr:hypothetical protein [Fibrisoma limi]